MQDQLARSIHTRRPQALGPLHWPPTVLAAVLAICAQAVVLQWLASDDTAPLRPQVPPENRQPLLTQLDAPSVQLAKLPQKLPVLPLVAVASAPSRLPARTQGAVARAVLPRAHKQSATVVAQLICDEEPLRYLQRQLDTALAVWGQRQLAATVPLADISLAAVPVQLAVNMELPSLGGDVGDSGSDDDDDEEAEDSEGQPPDPPDDGFGTDALIAVP